jgi:hypothetical protein
MFFRLMRATILNRKNLHFCVPGNRMIKTDRLLVHQDQVNLRVWNATRLNDVFYGRLFRKRPLDNCFARLGPKKNIEVAMKAKPDRKRLHVNLRSERLRKRIRKSWHAVAPGACRVRAVRLPQNSNRFASGAVRHRYP